MRQFFSSDAIVIDNAGSAGLLPAHLLRRSPVRSRTAITCALAAIALLAVLDWKIDSIQLSILALVPLAAFAWFANARVAYAVAFGMALLFTYFDYSGPQAQLVNLPLDTVFTVVSYLAMVAVVLAARGSVSSVVNLREQLAISAETVSIQRWLADHDALTSAANRRAFRKAMMQTGAAAGMHAGSFGLVVGDVDNFKAVNTRYGQRIGDRLLCMLFSRAQAACGGDAVVGRLDGDEIAVLFPGVKNEWDLFQSVTRLSKALRAPYAIDGTSVNLGITLATAMFPDESADTDVLLEVAEAKLYAAKRYGRPKG
jgi:diguanylate cyclase (GGDEF)-like protein